MKLLLTLALSVLLAGCISAPPEAPEPQVSVEQGKVIFNDPTLGTTGATCNTCHPNGGTIGGKVMNMPIPDLNGAAPTFPKFKEWAGKEITLSEMNNFCITQILKGDALDVQSTEMQSMNAYLQTLEGTPTSAPAYGAAAGAPGYK